ncbi:MAG: hypothetical protein M3467_01240 [Actinomycetota bacterium]|nr:hypothetical protein [Actinomycetota bacterium]
MAVVDQAPVELVDKLGQCVWPGVTLGDGWDRNPLRHRYLLLDLDDTTTSTAERPDSSARRCSHARWRQDWEHHLGIRPVVASVKVVPHHAHATI